MLNEAAHRHLAGQPGSIAWRLVMDSIGLSPWDIYIKGFILCNHKLIVPSHLFSLSEMNTDSQTIYMRDGKLQCLDCGASKTQEELRHYKKRVDTCGHNQCQGDQKSRYRKWLTGLSTAVRFLGSSKRSPTESVIVSEQVSHRSPKLSKSKPWLTTGKDNGEHSRWKVEGDAN